MWKLRPREAGLAWGQQMSQGGTGQACISAGQTAKCLLDTISLWVVPRVITPSSLCRRRNRTADMTCQRPCNCKELFYAYWWTATQLCINHPELQQTPQVKGKAWNIAPTFRCQLQGEVPGHPYFWSNSYKPGGFLLPPSGSIIC